VKSIVLLRIASVLAMIHCALHTIGGVFGTPKNGSEEVAVIETMKGHTFNVIGSMRTYWDFFFGYGLFVTVSLLFQGILFWILASFAKTNPALVRSIAGLFCLNYIFFSIIAFKYFFVGPGVAQLMIAGCLGAAYVTTSAKA
jgi:hypothetical protein